MQVEVADLSGVCGLRSLKSTPAFPPHFRAEVQQCTLSFFFAPTSRPPLYFFLLQIVTPPPAY
jgi:hypothetical protein